MSFRSLLKRIVKPRVPMAVRRSLRAVQRQSRQPLLAEIQKSIPQPYSVEISGLRDLLPGRHPGLDVICDGILKGTPFIYPAERFTGARSQESGVRERRRCDQPLTPDSCLLTPEKEAA